MQVVRPGRRVAGVLFGLSAALALASAVTPPGARHVLSAVAIAAMALG